MVLGLQVWGLGLVVRDFGNGIHDLSSSLAHTSESRKICTASKLCTLSSPEGIATFMDLRGSSLEAEDVGLGVTAQFSRAKA